MSYFKVSCSNCLVCVINGVACHEIGCNGQLTFLKQKRTYAKWSVWRLDVWGDEKYGFEVNDRHEMSSIMIPIDSTDKQIVQALKKKGLLNKRCQTRSFNIDGDDLSIYLNFKRNGEPIFQLERE